MDHNEIKVWLCNRHILFVIGDNEDEAHKIATALEEFGAIVTIKHCKKDGLDELQKTTLGYTYDLIITYVSLPGAMDYFESPSSNALLPAGGIEMIEEYRQSLSGSNVPVLYLANSEGPDLRTRSRTAAGPDNSEWKTSHVSISTLVETCARLIAHTPIGSDWFRELITE